ncbi:MAG: hypothetical protein R2867_26065 [Caldilineaceae bacterium]
MLWATGIAATADDSASLHIYGIDPTSAFYAPFQSGLVAGAYLTPDDRSGILIGQRLANNLGLAVDDNVSLTAINADGVPEEGSSRYAASLIPASSRTMRTHSSCR